MNMTVDQRKNVKVTPEVKERLDKLKKGLKVKTESEVMAYLISIYDDIYPEVESKTFVVRLKNTDQGSRLYEQSYFAEITAISEKDAKLQAEMKFGKDNEIGTVYEKGNAK